MARQRILTETNGSNTATPSQSLGDQTSAAILNRKYAYLSSDPKEAIRKRRKTFRDLYPTPDDLEKAVFNYFDNISTREYDTEADKWQTVFHTRPKLADLAASLGLSEHTMRRLALGNGGDDMAAILEAAINIIAAYNEDTLHEKASMAGSAFTLKQLGWRDDAPLIVAPNATVQHAMSIEELQGLLSSIPTVMSLPEEHTEVIINDDN